MCVVTERVRFCVAKCAHVTNYVEETPCFFSITLSANFCCFAVQTLNITLKGYKTKHIMYDVFHRILDVLVLTESVWVVSEVWPKGTPKHTVGLKVSTLVDEGLQCGFTLSRDIK